MKQVIFTTFLIAYIAISQNAFSQAGIIGNCPHYDPVTQCLTPYDATPFEGQTATKIEVSFQKIGKNPTIENTNWYVWFLSSDGQQVLIPKSDFVKELGVYKYKNNYNASWFWFPLPPNATSFSFTMYLMKQNGTVAKSFYAPFQICQGNNRLSSPDLQGTKNNSSISIESLENVTEDFKIYPNPVISDFTVEYQSIQNEVVVFQIFDIEGRTIYTTQFEGQDTGFYARQFNNLNLTKGLYFFNIQSDNFKKMLKVTKL